MASAWARPKQPVGFTGGRPAWGLETRLRFNGPGNKPGNRSQWRTHRGDLVAGAILGSKKHVDAIRQKALRCMTDERERYWISESLVRISVGLETPADIESDIQQALHAASEP